MAATKGRPASELSDTELEEQGTHAHATRNWVFLHGTAEQFAHHTERMLELEQEYLRRFPKRTWQGAGDAPQALDEATRLRLALRGVQRQIDALLAGHEQDDPDPADAGAAQVQELLRRLAAVGGHMHKLELHQTARELGIGPVALAALYKGAQPALRTDRDERVLVDQSRVPGGAGRQDAVTRHWTQEPRPRWDQAKQALFAKVPAGVFALDAEPGAELVGEWWAATDSDGTVLGYGWMDSSWGGDVEVLLAVAPDAREQGLGTWILERLEDEAASRGVNYVYNTVRETHPDRERLHDWLAVRGYRGSDADQALRKRIAPRVPADGAAPPAAGPAQRAGAAGGSGRGPGAEAAGGYVDVDDHQF